MAMGWREEGCIKRWWMPGGRQSRPNGNWEIPIWYVKFPSNSVFCFFCAISVSVSGFALLDL